MLLGTTGSGKSCTERFLRAEPDFGNTMARVEARESHRDSLIGFVRAVCLAVGVEKPSHRASLAEEESIAALTELPRLLFIDEMHHLGPRPLNFVKTMLNETKCTIVGVAIPALWDRMSYKSWAEAEQLTSRTTAVLRIKGISLDDARLFCASRVNRWEEIDPETRTGIANVLSVNCPRRCMWDGAAMFVKFLHEAAVGSLPSVSHAESAIGNLDAIRHSK
jgi:type II secretory pathway predicted ATPase ExeA